ncbi:ExbD/TolR family protein [Peristeroidobacter agariperforans]|uniref:ExbD/TolR family protein n=1 Tax=Peristeroidobacter agariperforans TaxID=268404 RepID=UPI00101D8A9F|nr:biopolymer transporter ExbD [Peristeroidobacter agariperforans]
MSLLNRSQPRSDAELNLIPLIDIMSVMVAFLLIYSTEVEVVQNSKGIEIPQSTAEVKPQNTVVVMITKEHVFVQGEAVATIAEVQGTQTPLVEPLREVLERPMLTGKKSDADTVAASEVTVIADKSLPFDIVKRVMATCSASSYGKISLAVLQKEKAANAAS